MKGNGDDMRRTNLASRDLGASVLAANDESFGEKENLVVDAPSAFVPGRYGHRGEIVDGWETRRRGGPGEDWAMVALGAPGVVEEIVVDTTAFTGNFPERCRVQACGVQGHPSPAELAAAAWDTLVDWSPLAGDARNVFPVASPVRYTHVRLDIATDGGVARLRVNGRVVVDPEEVDGVTVDLAGRAFGGVVESSSDDFYSTATVLNHPHPARHMGEGWETRRRRGPGHDHAVLRLAPGEILMVEVDTSYYVHNASKEFALWVSTAGQAPPVDGDGWVPLIGRTRVQPDARQRFRVASVPARYLRLDAHPDGGISRLRVIGRIGGSQRRALGRAWFDSLPAGQALDALATRCDLSGEAARRLVAARPLGCDALAGLPQPVRALIDGSDDRLPA